jgi:molybdopterin/thiamine biosynthesis adenylyltransferase/rhodanese-related sulfurtransferase/molybdopterin converting factor small subunit
MTRILLPTPLRPFADGHGEIELSAPNLSELLARLTEAHPALVPHLFDPAGGLRRFITIFINGEDHRIRDGLASRLEAGDVVEILPAIAGGTDAAVPFADLRRELEEHVRQVDPQDVGGADDGPVILDVRTAEEWREGHLPGAIHIDRGFLEMSIESHVQNRSQPIICYCASGTRSLLAARALEQMGYADVASLRGGIQGWSRSGRDVVTPIVLDDAARRRYRRHLAISEVGEAGQKRLLESRVLVVGAGGLGSPVLLYLAAAGIGTIGIVDDDLVDESNLQRQVVHSQAAVGSPKTQSARESLLALNPSIEVECWKARLDADLATTLFPQFDVIVDGTDNFTSRYLINDLAVAFDRPVVHGSVYRFEGQVSVFKPHVGPCYRCLYPEPPPPELAPSCAEAGVLGVLPGVIGLFQATETLKLLLNCGKPLIGRALRYDALGGTVRELRFQKDPQCAVCGTQGDIGVLQNATAA